MALPNRLWLWAMLAVDFYKIPIGASLGFIVMVLGGAVAASWFWPRVPAADGRESPPAPETDPLSPAARH